MAIPEFADVLNAVGGQLKYSLVSNKAMKGSGVRSASTYSLTTRSEIVPNIDCVALRFVYTNCMAQPIWRERDAWPSSRQGRVSTAGRHDQRGVGRYGPADNVRWRIEHSHRRW